MSLTYKMLAASKSGVVEQNPNPFNFSNLTNVGLSSYATSNQITITGLTANAPVTVSVNTGQVDAGTTALSGSWSSSKEVTVSPSGTIVVRPRRVSSSSYYSTTSQTVTVGTGSDSWTNRTVDIDLSPSSFPSQTLSGLTAGTFHYFSAHTITGITPSVSYQLTRYSNTDLYNLAVGTTSPGTFYSNPTTLNFTSSGSGTAVFQAEINTPYYWYQSSLAVRLRSPYSGAYSGLSYQTARTSTFTSGTTSASAPAGTTYDFAITMSNLPTGAPGYSGPRVIWRGDVSTGFVELSWNGTNWYSGASYLDMNDAGAPSLSATSVTFYLRVTAPSTPGQVSYQYLTCAPTGNSNFLSASVSRTLTAT